MVQKKSQDKIPTYLVIFDTQILLRYLPAIKSLIDTYKSDKRAKIAYQIFDLVADEYKHNYWALVEKEKIKHKNASHELAQLLSLKIASVEIPKADVYKKAEDKLRGLGIEIKETPYEKLSLKDIAHRAAFHELPFQSEGDKGFKDTVIADSILQLLPQMTKDTIIVFICNDDLLRKHTQVFTETHQNFKVYQSPVDFETELRLYLLKLNDQLVSEIKKEAEKTFYTQANKSSLFYSKDIIQRIQQAYPSLFNNPQPVRVNQSYWITAAAYPATSWISADEPTYTVSKPNFVEKQGEEYVWNTSVIYKQKFKGTSNWFTFAASSDLPYEEAEYVLEFSVEWKTKIDKNCKVISADIGRITYRKPQGYLDVVGSYYQVPQSNATLVGQGTVPVTYSGVKLVTGKDYSPEDE